jgi:hypothetical protein
MKNKKTLYIIINSIFLLLLQPVFAEIIVDGSLDDWKGIEPLVKLDNTGQLSELPGNWQGPNDLSGTIFLTQDAENIYISAEVRDDKPLWNPRKAGVQAGWWKVAYDGDALRVKVMGSSATTDLFLFPGAFGIIPEIYIHKGTGTTSGKLEKAEIASSYANKFSGYIVESKIPKSALGLTSNKFSVQFELFDGDGTVTSNKSLKSKMIPLPKEK